MGYYFAAGYFFAAGPAGPDEAQEPDHDDALEGDFDEPYPETGSW